MTSTLRKFPVRFCPVLFGLMLISGPALADIKVFTCEPEWTALAQEIGGKLVDAESATHGLQDPHYIQARPSLIAKVRQADLLVCTGSQLEAGWLPALLTKANNPKVLPGQDGFLEAGSLVRKLDIPESVDRSQGDMHVGGNPHVQGNPHNFTAIAKGLAERMSRIDPDNAAAYQSGLESFLRRWETAIQGWEQRAQPLRGRKVVAHHRSFTYLEDWLGLQELATLEPLPGIPPTSSHLAELLESLGTDGKGADYIIREAYQTPKASEWLADKTKIPAVMLPTTVGGSKEAVDLFSLFDDVLNRLLGAKP